jgi:DNA-binding CsgD family transcriptional regulator
MKFLLQQDRRFYFFALYVGIVLFWVLQEYVTIKRNINCIQPTDRYFDILEIGIALLPVIGIYLLFKDIKRTKNEVSLAKDTIEHLKNQNVKLNEMNKSFWESIQKEFKKWNFTLTEKEISVFILRGLSNQQIAGLRGKSLKTIENQTFSIYQKSGTTGKLEFIAYFLSPLLPDED